jgi:hypothetical protein
MHLGPYDGQGSAIARLHASIADQGYTPRGKHHEPGLVDPRRAAPAKLRAVLRQPVA